MKNNFALKALGLTLTGAGLAFGGYWIGSHYQQDKGSGPALKQAAGRETIDPKSGRKVLYWHDPMMPGQKFDKPGKSPFMDMELVPVYADEAGGDGGVKVSPMLQQNLGIRYATVRREETKDAFEFVGTTQFDESVVEVVQSRVTGYIERLHARAPMQRIKRGESVATLFVPEWIAPQEEYLALKRSGNDALASAARDRMRTLSIPDSLVAQLERTGKVQRNLTLTSPVAGVVTELPIRDGAMVSPGMTVAKVAALSKVWLVAEIPEQQANAVRPGMKVDASFAGNPDRKYSGQVREILPGVSVTTRTVQARLELDNRDDSLTPGMLMRVQVRAEKAVPRLVVPTEAVITSGKRSVVLVAAENNSIQPVVVTTGRDMGDNTEVLSGLTEGQKVVASGQFLIDSEARLKSVLPKYAGQEQSQASARPSQGSAGKAYKGVGKVEKVSQESITFSHKPIPELKWPAMTMDFSKPRPDAFGDIKVGQDAEFSFKEGSDGSYVLESVTPAGGGKK
ncbi:efflux RND transporter periplasmic adaptor subunit [Noviherbaspirillum sp. Root189]|uniref:efflux RND transporter periplasmic adaptor subunit n=1 Tax=Noviherbaspirillum sp. Root189 TaxID=1736487 RepID=UPI00071023E8|nr:efflux RND transporter periplasmic adaptor subunit [Noviherbaspirillum sp. Root189]KRB79518.1 RND transporter MFP subunit [Noviherbaspirillum sp. Root189]